MGARKDYRGRRSGKLVAIEPTGETIRGSVVWLCKCDCGNYKKVTVKDLTTGNVKSCGCIRGRRGEDLTGKRFGQLVALENTGKKKFGHPVYLCRCDCGNVKEVISNSLVSGATKSCGCLNRGPQRGGIRDLTGQKFGYLTAISPTGEMQGGYPVWDCQCDCGGHRAVSEFCLVYGRTKYCGRKCPKFKEAISGRKTDRPKDRTPRPKSGVVGVSATRSGRWQARKNRHYIGTYDTIKEAADAIELYMMSVGAELGR